MGRKIVHADYHDHRVKVNGYFLDGWLLADPDGLVYALVTDAEGAPVVEADGSPRVECYRGIVEILPPGTPDPHAGDGR